MVKINSGSKFCVCVSFHTAILESLGSQENQGQTVVVLLPCLCVKGCKSSVNIYTTFRIRSCESFRSSPSALIAIGAVADLIKTSWRRRSYYGGLIGSNTFIHLVQRAKY